MTLADKTAPSLDNLLSMTVHTGAIAGTYYAVKDHLGTVHALTDGSGTVVESYRFDAWGNVLGVFDSSGSEISSRKSEIGNRYLWQGREYSWLTGFYYFRARWYDPRVGRWLSNDPIGIAGGLNQYVFCGNDPVNNEDPYGLWEASIGAGDVFAVQLTVSKNTLTGRKNIDITMGLGYGAKIAWTPSFYDNNAGKNLKGGSVKIGAKGSVSGGFAKVCGAGVNLDSTIDFDGCSNWYCNPRVGGSLNLGPLQGSVEAGGRDGNTLRNLFGASGFARGF